MLHTKTYKNGLRLICEENEKDVASLNIIFNVGSKDEEKHQEGFAHFIEHMIFKGTKDLSAVNIMDKLTFYGADFNAYTSRNTTKFVFKCLSENFEKCFEIYSNMLLDAEFDEEELDRERQVVIEEMKRSDDYPSGVMYKRAMENYFDGLSYAHDELGGEEIIENVSRQELLNFKEKYYKAENCVISVVGNLKFEEVDKMIQKYFASRFDYSKKPKTVDFEPYNLKILKRYDIVERNDNQSNVCIFIKSVTSTDELKHVADLYSSILGNSQNSRLFKTIREKMGLVYTIYAYNVMSPKTGGLEIAFGTRSKNVKKAIQEIKKIIVDFAERGATEEELARAKNWKKSCVSFGMESNSDLSEINGTIFNLYNKPFDKQERIEKIENVSLEAVNSFAKRIANEPEFVVVAVGKGLKQEDIEVFC